MKAHIEVYCRLKPCTSRYGPIAYKVSEDNKSLSLQIPKNSKYGHVNNTKENLEFNFSRIFDQESSQEEIFENVAKPVVLNCLEGYNGTIFTYGQTGSGKTFTMSGPDNWKTRGVIPRVLSFLFDEFESRTEMEYNMYISFMEIYNEVAYDLLDKRHVESSIESWNKVHLMEDDYGNIHLKNLSVHQCHTEQDGMDLLMMGNFIRQVSSTPLNQCSSRSHAIFTITIEGKRLDSETYFVSKLHLVDLAGSERVSKSQVDGNTLLEAKHINLSLTYLEQVIIALHEKKLGNRHHVPYRNSLMTTILRDSLGGNCKTVMIATLSTDFENLDEDLSTSRFSQRCSQLINEIKKNEKIDLNVMVKKLEFENLQLQEELAYYKLHFGKKPLNDGGKKGKKEEKPQEEEKTNANGEKIHPSYIDIAQTVELFLNDQTDDLNLNDMEEAKAYIRAMKEYYANRTKEYIDELSLISSKLRKYEDILARRREQYIQINQSNSSSNLQNGSSNAGIYAYNGDKGERGSIRSTNTTDEDEDSFNPNPNFASVYDRYSKDMQGQGQGRANYQNQQLDERRSGIYNITRAYQTEAIIEAPDENDY